MVAMVAGDSGTESVTPPDQMDLWVSEIKLLHEDIRNLEQNIIRSGVHCQPTC